MAQSVRTWLGADGSQSWLDHCQTLIARHVGVGAPTLLLSSLKTKGNLFLAELLRIKCSDLDHYHRLMLVMIKLAAVQDAIISHVHQEHLRALSKMRLGQQTERLRSEVAGTVEEASMKSADLRIRVDGFAASTQTIVKGNHEIAATSNQIAAAMDETATNALDLITALRQAKTEVAEAATIAQAASLGANAAVDSAGSLAQHPQAIESMLDFIRGVRSDEHTSELQSLMRISYAGRSE